MIEVKYSVVSKLDYKIVVSDEENSTKLSYFNHVDDPKSCSHISILDVDLEDLIYVLTRRLADIQDLEKRGLR